MNQLQIAVVGKSAFFPAPASTKTFWPALLGLDGLIAGLASAQWPFNECFPEALLKNLKGFVMNSGILASGTLPADGFEIPAEILSIADVIPVLGLFLARQALEKTSSFSSGRIAPAAVSSILAAAPRPGLPRDQKTRPETFFFDKLTRHFGFSNPTPESGTEPVSPPLPGMIGTFVRAARALSEGKTDLVLVGGLDCHNPLLAHLESGNQHGTTIREGFGFVTLRRLANAEHDGDTILAVISGIDATSITLAGTAPASAASSTRAATAPQPSHGHGSAPARQDGSVNAVSAVVSGRPPATNHPAAALAADAAFRETLNPSMPGVSQTQWSLSLADHPWINDHRPNYVIPALPLMSGLDLMASLLEQQTGARISGLTRLEASHWVAFDQPRVNGIFLCRAAENGNWRADLLVEHQGRTTRALAAEFRTGVVPAAPSPAGLPPLQDAREEPLPYKTFEVSHGERFHLLDHWLLGRNGAAATVKNTVPGIPPGRLNQGMLDATLHAIPWTRLERWFPQITPGTVAYPILLEQMQLFGSIPTDGTTQVEIRTLDGGGLPRLQIWLFCRNSCFATFQLSAFSLPLGHFAPLSAAKRRAFFRDRRFVTGAAVSDLGAQESRVSRDALTAIDWLPNTLNRLFQVNGSSGSLGQRVVQAEHLAQFARLHPADMAYDSVSGLCPNLPFNPITLTTGESDGQSFARGTMGPTLDWKKIRECWVRTTGPRRFFHDLLGALFGAFVSRIVVQKPEEFQAVASRPIVYLANHQIGLESPLFMALSFGMTGVPIQAVAKPDHINAWLDFLMAFAKDSLPGNQPFHLVYFDKTQPLGLIETLKKSEVKHSLLVHVEGTRSTEAGQPVTRMSSIFLDMAIEKNVPMVPVRFVGGLPNQPSTDRLDFPVGNGRQDYFFGAPILPEKMKSLPYAQRPRYVMEAINSLGPLNDEDLPLEPNREFEAKTKFFKQTFGFPGMQAMLFALLGLIDDPCEETALLLKAVQSGKLSEAAAAMPPVLRNFLQHVKTKMQGKA